MISAKKTHLNTTVFCQYTVLLKLKAIGIPSEVLPVTESSELLVEEHLAWIAQREKEEETEAAEPPSKRSRAVRSTKVEAIPGVFAPPLFLEGGFKNNTTMQSNAISC